MTSPAVVILTEPTHCEAADANSLVQAMLQVQQLSEAGVPVSQAFCDHPSDAMKFIDAYARAYPELQMQSSDLPLPEDLYSMIAEGRLSPLQALDPTRDSGKLEEAARLQPLYVLSLGAPEALMHALQDNGFASNSIRVLEIAPIEESNADSVSVAEAVAARPLANPSWFAETSASIHMRDDEPLEASADAPLKLESVELDLDDIKIDENEAQAQRSGPAAAVVDINPVIPAAREADAERPVRDRASKPDSEPVADRPSQPSPAAAAKDEPEPEERESARTERNVADPSTDRADAPDDADPDVPPDDGAKDPSGPSEEANPPGETDPIAGKSPDAPGTGSEEPDPSGSAGAEDEAAEPEITGRHQQDARGDTSFRDPDGDVLYPTNGFASDDNDLLYALPTGGAPEPGTFDHLLSLSVVDDDVDLEAMSRRLPDALDDPAARLDPLDPALTRPPASAGLGADRSRGHDPHADPGYSDGSEPEDGADHEQATPLAHDLDI